MTTTGVIVTGGASGIGAACAHALAEAGRPVALWDRDDASFITGTHLTVDGGTTAVDR